VWHLQVSILTNGSAILTNKMGVSASLLDDDSITSKSTQVQCCAWVVLYALGPPTVFLGDITKLYDHTRRLGGSTARDCSG